MKTVSDNIFVLIKSLTKNEKRYFKRFAGIHVKGNTNNYIKLFDAVDKQKDKYDERKLRQSLKGETFLSQLSREKNYLFNVILKSLRTYHTNISISVTIRNQLNNAEILYEKGQYDLSFNTLKEAKKLATLVGSFHDNLSATFIERGLAMQTKKIDIKEVINRRKELVKGLETHLIQEEVFYLIVDYRSKFGQPKNKSQEKKLFNYINIKSLEYIKYDNLDYRNKQMYNLIYIALGHLLNDTKLNYKYSKKMLVLYEEYPKAKKLDELSYLNAYQNILLSCIQNGKYEEGLFYLKKTEKIKLSNENTILKQKGICLLYGVNLYLRMEKYNEGVVFFESFKSNLENYLNALGKAQKVGLYQNISLLYFAVENYNKSLDWINDTLNGFEATDNVNSILITRILEIVLHYQLGNSFLLENKIPSLKRFIKKYDLENIVTTSIIEYYSAINNTGHRKSNSANEERNNLLTRLNEISKSKSHHIYLFSDLLIKDLQKSK